MPIVPNTERVAFPERGPTSSKTLNDFSDQVVTDIHTISVAVNSNESKVDDSLKLFMDEMAHLKRDVQQLKREHDAKLSVDARNGLRVMYHQSMYDTSNLSFFTNDSLTPTINTTYGIAHLPINAVEEKFFTSSLFDGNIVSAPDLVVEVTDDFADEAGDPITSHESNGSILKGETVNAFNGNNQSYWVRTVSFPADSDVSEVQCEITITVPSQNNTRANMLSINPYPVGNVDILDVSTSSDVSSSFVQLNHTKAPSTSKPHNNSSEKRFIFPAVEVQQVKVRLRQRNFLLEEGKKIFRYGMQELSLRLVEFEKSSSSLSFSAWSSQADSDNIAMVHKIDAPMNTIFTALNHFSSDPDFSLEEAGSRHIMYRIYDSDPVAGAANELWNSNQTLPQNQSSTVGSHIAIGGHTRTIHVATSFRFIQDSGGVNSPYKTLTSPFVEGFTLEFSVNSLS